MSWVRKNVALLRRNNRLWIACSMVAAFVTCMTFAVMEPKWDMKVVNVLCAMLNLVLLLDMIDTSKKDEHRTELTRLLADKEDEIVVLKGELVKKDDEIEILKATTSARKDNPIKSNRIVSDKTFAIRFKSFVEEVRCSDPMSEEEAGYLISVAERLLKWQTKTVRKDSEEYKYLERNGLMPHPSDNAEEHAEETKPKKRTAPKRKPKTETTENENKD